ncbi:MAG: molybdopterin-dependent oxidoreductase [Planctomycetes bacterium]|nr:molybdopterin-dependent oxidoreductase [Planctomycetota bacterium]
MPKLTIDGRSVEVPKGTTIIQAARQLGTDVPHYCWHPGLSIAGNCRICLVEVEGMPTLQIACNTQCSDNMVVRTASDKAKRGRADVMELLLINHPLDCPICDQAGECKLQEYSFRIGNDRSRFDFPKVHKPKHVKFSDKVMFDAERCILCTRCVRFMDEIAKSDELDISNRGDRNEISVKRGGELESPYQMNIIDVCPVGALTSQDFRFKSRVWFLESTHTVCSGCSRGCNVTAGARWNKMLRLIPRENAAVNKWWMCDEGRLTYTDVAAADRLGAPMVRKDGRLVEVSWDEALAAAAKGLAAAGDDLFALISARLTNEEIWLASKLCDALGTPHRDTKPRAFGKDDLLRTGDGNPNSAGARILGVAPGKGGAGLANFASQNLAGAALFGEDLDDRPEAIAALQKLAFVLVVDSRESETMRKAAHVVLPGLTAYEKDGSFTNVTGRVQRIAPCVRSPGDAWPDWKILGWLVAGNDRGARPKTCAEVFARMAAAVPEFSGMTHGMLGTAGLDVRSAAPAQGSV